MSNNTIIYEMEEKHPDRNIPQYQKGEREREKSPV